MKTYPIHEGQFLLPAKYRDVKAVFSGEKRPPKKGEWYLSGAVVGAYKAPNDLSTAYHIARLVKVKRVTVERIEPFDEV